jgi:TusA-related sulfurtransferase
VSGDSASSGEVVDARGLLCPLPVIRLAERFDDLPAGEGMDLLADDPAAEDDVRLWCRGRGYTVESVSREGRTVRIRVRKSG